MRDQPSGTTRAPAFDAEFRIAVEAALRAGDERMTRIEAQLTTNTAKLDDNTTKTNAIQKDTSEIVELFQAMKGGVRVLGWLGQLAKIVAPLIGLYMAIRKAGLAGGWWPFH